MYKLVLICVVALASSLSANAAAIDPATCERKVERAVRGVLYAEGFEEVLSCRDTLLDTCLFVEPSREAGTYFVRYVHGSPNYPNYYLFHVKVSGYCEIERISVERE